MKKLIIIFSLIIINISAMAVGHNSFFIEKTNPQFNNRLTGKPENQMSPPNCKLMAEQINGVVEISYEYDSQGRLSAKKYLRLKYEEKFYYDIDGFLIKIENTSENPFTTFFEYTNGKLTTKTLTFRRFSDPIKYTYEYDSDGILIKMTEINITVTTTEFANGKAVKVTNPFIEYTLNVNGLVIKSRSKFGPQTENFYKYDKNDMLVLHEIYSEPGKKIMYNEYRNTRILRGNLGSDFIETYKGIPVYKDPFGAKTYHVAGMTNYTSNFQTGNLEKSYQTETSHTIDNSGKVVNMLSTNDISSPVRVFVYSECN